MAPPGGSTSPEPGSAEGIQAPGVRGYGAYDEDSGLYEWYEVDEGVIEDPHALTWARILTHWLLIEADLHQTYGVDVETPGLLAARTARWLRTRIVALAATDSRLHRALRPPEEGKT